MTNTESQNPGAPIDARSVWQSLCVLHDEHPAEALTHAVACGQAIVPYLLETLREAHADPAKYVEGEMADAPVFALLLLAQLRVKEAFPLIVDFFCRDDDFLDDLVGDGLTEYLPALLASTYDGQIGTLVEMAINQELNEYVATAAICTVGSLVIAGKIEKKAAVTALIEIGNNLPKKAPGHWTDLAIVAARLRAQELYPMIDRAFVEGKIPKEEIPRSDYEKLKKTEFTKGDDRDFRLIDDVVAETSWWSVFNDEESDEPFDDEDFDDEDDAGPDVDVADEKAPAPFVNPDKKVGRNDLCPCGSGRKWKKCCGS